MNDSTWVSGNSPVYDESGHRVWLKECWRRPGRPFAAPMCHEQRAKRIGRNVYRCGSCATKIWPERLWHRLLLWRNPFRGNERHPFRVLVRVTRWAR